MSTEKIRENARKPARDFFKRRELLLAKRYKEKGDLYKAKIHLFASLRLEIESYLEKNHSAKIEAKTEQDKTIKEESRSDIYFAHYTSVETIYSILEKYQTPQKKRASKA